MRRSDAIFATSLVVATPTDAVSPTSSRTAALIIAAIVAAVAEQWPRPGDVEERLVDRDRLDLRREPAKDGHDVARRLLVAPAVDRQEHAVRAAPDRLAQRHRRVDAEPARLVARRRHDPAAARVAADDDRLAAQLRAVALLDGREERVEVDVEDRPLGHGRYHPPSVQSPADDRSGFDPLPSTPVIVLILGLAGSLVLAWSVPILAVVLVWPWLFAVPGWVIVRRVAPDLPRPGVVGVGIVASTYLSAHSVELVSRARWVRAGRGPGRGRRCSRWRPWSSPGCATRG